ncbi:MAG: hypothetical protein ACLPVY_03570 [Acidimicrobiia bacterium]
MPADVAVYTNGSSNCALNATADEDQTSSNAVACDFHFTWSCAALDAPIVGSSGCIPVCNGLFSNIGQSPADDTTAGEGRFAFRTETPRDTATAAVPADIVATTALTTTTSASTARTGGNRR